MRPYPEQADYQPGCQFKNYGALMKTETVVCPALIIIIVIIIIISCHRFSFFPGTSPLEPVVNPTTQASSLSL
jgi:hypothetical protein